MGQAEVPAIHASAIIGTETRMPKEDTARTLPPMQSPWPYHRAVTTPNHSAAAEPYARRPQARPVRGQGMAVTFRLLN